MVMVMVSCGNLILHMLVVHDPPCKQMKPQLIVFPRPFLLVPTLNCGFPAYARCNLLYMTPLATIRNQILFSKVYSCGGQGLRMVLKFTKV